MSKPTPSELQVIRSMSRRRFITASAAGLAVLAAGMTRLRPADAAPFRKARATLAHDEVRQASSLKPSDFLPETLASNPTIGTTTFESDVISSPFAFTHVGLHWSGSGPQLGGVTLELRTSADGQQWSVWQETSVEAPPAATQVGDTFGSLAAAPRHRFLRYRALVPVGASLSKVTTTFINSKDGAALEALPLPMEVAHPAVQHTRSSWGADESLRLHNSREIWNRMFVPVKKLVIHHTVSGDFTDSAADVRAIYYYHAVTLGWGDIGYNFLIGPVFNADGEINGWEVFEGRYGEEGTGFRRVFNPQVVAGHALAHNYGTCGVAILGNFEVNRLPPDPYAEGGVLDTLLNLLEVIAGDWGVNPGVSSSFLQSGGAWTENLSNVCGHRDCTATLCPGRYLYPELPEIRARLAARLARSAAPKLSGSSGRVASRQLDYSWSVPRRLQVQYSLEGWHKEPDSEDIEHLTGLQSSGTLNWSPWSSKSSVRFSDLDEGHYTLHLRAGYPLNYGPDVVTHESNETVYVNRARKVRRKL